MISLLETLANFWLFIANVLLFLAIAGFLIPKRIKKEKIEPDVSVIIAVWNEGERVKRTLKSIFKQNYPRRKFEVIVSGGGDDNTAEICSEYQRRGMIKYIFEKKRMGKWYALQKALKRTKYEYIAFIDADCIAEKNWLRKLTSEIGSYDLIISRANSVASKTTMRKTFSVFYPFFDYFGDNLYKFFAIPSFFGFGSLMKKRVLKDVQFKKSIVEDWRFLFDMIRKKYTFIRSNDAFVYHHIPKTPNDFRKGILRVFEGFIHETIPQGDWFALLFLFLLLTTVVGVLPTIYLLISGNCLTIFTVAVSFLQFILFSIIVSAKEKNSSILLSTLIFIPSYLFFAIIGAESLLRNLIGKKVGWPLYEKLGR